MTCLSLSSDGTAILTGSKDTTLIVWNVQLPETRQQGLFSSIFSSRELPLPRLIYKFTLVGHDDVVTCCDFSAEVRTMMHCVASQWVSNSMQLNLCASGSNDGTALVFDLATGSIIASLDYGCDPVDSLHAITHIKLITDQHISGSDGRRAGKVFSYCGEHNTLHLHALDGRVLAVRQDVHLPDNLDETSHTTPFFTSMAFSCNGRYGVSGRSDGVITIWNLDDLSVRDSMDMGQQRGDKGPTLPESITSLALFDDRLLLVGLKSGLLKTFPLAL